MKLADKRCLITGGTRGIGAATALEFARRGADVALTGRFMDADAHAVKHAIENGTGRRCILIPGDVAQPEACRQAVRQTVEELGALDVLFHNAGGAVPGSLMEVSAEAWYAAFDVHVHPIYHLCREAIPLMRERGEGAILLMSSAAGIRGCPGNFAYQTVKGTIVQITRALARELADSNIRVNCVAPGVIRTRFHESMTPEQVQNNLQNRIPLHREGTVEDVAELAALLVENEFITGETVSIDGGITMRIA